MRKNLLLLIVNILITPVLQAQWVNDPTQNTLIATGENEYGEIYLATHEATGNTFIQWSNMKASGWNPSMQMIDVNGIPQWDGNGIVVNSNQNSTFSTGVSIAATADGCVISHFADIRLGEDNLNPFAVKIDANGNFLWGENGIQTFTVGNNGACRTETLATEDGGAWLAVNDGVDVYVRHVSADGTLANQILIHDNDGKMIFYPQLILGRDNSVFVVYQKAQYQYTYFYNKEIYVARYATDGTMLHEPVLLMGEQTMASYIEHYATSDCMDGGYVWISHPASGMFETYVFHFNDLGESTITGTNGVLACQPDGLNYHLGANAIADPNTTDLYIALRETDAQYESNNTLLINRISANGVKLWEEDGLVIVPTNTDEMSNITFDAVPNTSTEGTKAILTYMKGSYTNRIVEAFGINSDGGMEWQSYITTCPSAKSMADNTSGFHNGQLIFAWDDERNGHALYGQNIHADGTSGIADNCPPATNLTGEYYYNEEDASFGALITCQLPDGDPLTADIYRSTDNINYELIANDPITTTGEYMFYDEVEIGTYYYKLKLTYDMCVSDFATTSNGEDFVMVNVTSIDENPSSQLKVYQQNGNLVLQGVDIRNLNIYNVTGQLVNSYNDGNNIVNICNYNSGAYVIQVITIDNQNITKRIVIK